MFKLYGDGIHDDLPAIQEMIDSGESLVYLPKPKKNYVISGAIRMHSNQELRLDRYTLIRLAPFANSTMIENADVENWNENISISGGIWDMNHKEQHPNPLHYPSPDTGLKLSEELEKLKFDKTVRQRMPVYTGMCFVFNGVKGFNFGNLTIKNPVVFGIDLSYVEDFTVENIFFDYTEGSPKLWNMDGIHIEGGCKNGVIRNLRGACHDDMVAITSDDFMHGPIENIVVDGVFAQNSHSAVRLLSYKNPVRNVHITNIFGTFYANAVVMSKYHQSDDKSFFENITIDHIHASFCKGTVDVPGNRSPLINIGEDMEIKSLYISHFFRDETHNPLPTIGIKKGTHIGLLSVEKYQQTNSTGKPITFIQNDGIIDRLCLNLVDTGDDELICTGDIKNFN